MIGTWEADLELLQYCSRNGNPIELEGHPDGYRWRASMVVYYTAAGDPSRAVGVGDTPTEALSNLAKWTRAVLARALPRGGDR